MLLISLMLPTLLLMTCAVYVPRSLERRVPETVMGMVINALVSSLIMWILAAGFFAVLYFLQERATAAYLGQPDGVQHFLALGGKSVIVWAPIVLLVVWNSPKRWRTETW